MTMKTYKQMGSHKKEEAVPKKEGDSDDEE